MTYYYEKPRIFVMCKATFKQQKLHGAWINAVQHEDEILNDINVMLQTSPKPHAKAYTIHRYAGFGGIRFDGSISLKQIAELAQFVEDYGPNLATGLYRHTKGDLNEARYLMDVRYYGHYDSEYDFAIEYFKQLHLREIPETLRDYIDYQKVTEDLFNGSDYLSINDIGTVHVFDYS